MCSHPQNHCRFTLAKIRLASHPDTGSDILAKLTRNSCCQVLVRVAENSNTKVDTLRKLVFHECPDVRIAVGENRNTPLALLLVLECDEHVDVRYSLAENHNSSPVVLTVLAEDENPYVASRAYRTLRRIGISKDSTVFELASRFGKSVWQCRAFS